MPLKVRLDRIYATTECEENPVLHYTRIVEDFTAWRGDENKVARITDYSA
jgi:hypothetical protein